MENGKDTKKKVLRIVIGIIVAIILLIAGADEIRESLGDVVSSIGNLKEDIQDIKEGD